jgi:hypothetical protein
MREIGKAKTGDKKQQRERNLRTFPQKHAGRMRRTKV